MRHCPLNPFKCVHTVSARLSLLRGAKSESHMRLSFKNPLGVCPTRPCPYDLAGTEAGFKYSEGLADSGIMGHSAFTYFVDKTGDIEGLFRGGVTVDDLVDGVCSLICSLIERD